jgi:hypothetical protein
VLGWHVRAAALVALASLGLVAGGVYVARHDQRGEATTAKVMSCQTRYKLPPLCRGTWIEGDLVGGGRVVSGTIDGVNRGDLGEEVGVRADGDSAWTVSRRLPVILVGAGIAVALIGAGTGLRGAVAKRRSPTPPPGGIAPIGTDL